MRKIKNLHSPLLAVPCQRRKWFPKMKKVYQILSVPVQSLLHMQTQVRRQQLILQTSWIYYNKWSYTINLCLLIKEPKKQRHFKCDIRNGMEAQLKKPRWVSHLWDKKRKKIIRLPGSQYCNGYFGFQQINLNEKNSNLFRILWFFSSKYIPRRYFN